MLLDIVLFAIGVVLLYYGAEWLVKGSSSLAKSLGLAPLLIGLTVVAFGTSAPEMVISVISSFKGKSMIAVGNVIGSNICNIALVLGLAAFINPITSQKGVVKRDIPIMLGVSLFLMFISWNSKIGRIEGAVLFTGLIIYICYNYFGAKRMLGDVSASDVPPIIADETEKEYISSRSKQITMIVTGIAGVVIGADLLVDSAVKIMKVMGVGEKFIGLTIVALGTSLPELATSVIAAVRKEMDISIGNLVGSNVFNILGVLGLATLIRPVEIPGGFFESGMLVDYLVMLFVSFLPWFMMRKVHTIGRAKAIILLGIYVGYIIFLSFVSLGA
ncbi:MAG: calcium/sodium antiporter [Desulfobacterales bacterium]|nr:calcium/sodium antiporter [Desulfobacterales bacterium]